MSDSELTLGAVLARLEEQEREIAAQAEPRGDASRNSPRSWKSSTGLPRRSASPAKPLLELPDPSPPTPPAAKLPNHPAYRQIMAVFATADAPLRARAVCEAMDWRSRPATSTTSG